jgi:methylated-DNA-[protein]-cysteine S-methyltransferase
MSWTVIDSPVGELRLVEHDGALTQIEFEPFSPVGQSHDGRPRGARDDDHPLLVETARQLRAYFDRDLKEFDLPLAPVGTDFQRRVWQGLCEIGYGETSSYGELAHRLGKTNAASRAVGLANGRNPIPIVIPCHRIVRSGGDPGNYGGGPELKKWLLRLEGSLEPDA